MRMVAIIPKEPFLDAEAIIRAVENTLTMAARDAKIDFDVTTATWDARPDFVIVSTPGSREVFTENKIYFFINRGTAIRYATMSPGFAPKTRNRFIGSNKGRGGKLFVSRKYPRPGIEAREFDLAIKEKWDRYLPRLLQRAIDAEVSRMSRR